MSYWYHVIEKLPDDKQRVLVCYQDQVHIMLFVNQCPCGNEDHFIPDLIAHCFDTYQIEYWQLLPKPPAPKHKEVRPTTRQKRPLNNKFNTYLKEPRKKTPPIKIH